jgi:hypothetical protein
MSFNIGDRVIPIDVDDLKIFGEGTIVGNYYGSRPPKFDDIIGYYINFDTGSGPTYNFVIDAVNYTNIYMMYTERLELVGQENSRPPLPEDPRLKGICLKIRDLDKKFKRRQEIKAKSIADALTVEALLEEARVHHTIYRDGTIGITTTASVNSF